MTIAAVRHEGAAKDPVLEERRTIEAVGALDPIWDELYPAGELDDNVLDNVHLAGSRFDHMLKKLLGSG